MSFNSDRQLGMITSGSWGIDEKSFLNGSIVYTRTPTSYIAGEHDTYYQGSVGAGYAINNIAFDVGFQFSKSPLTEVTSLGGSFGFTYIVVPHNGNAEDYEEDALTALHSQAYRRAQEEPPLFWLRFGYTGNTMKTDVVPFPANSGKETSLSLDGYYPYSDVFLFSLGLGFHGYDNQKGFYTTTLQNSVTAQQQMLQSTLQGLPHSNISLSMTWQFTQMESLLPRYQGTEIDSTRKWAHTVDFAWRHQFTKHWYMTPAYEVTVYQASTSTGVILDLLYVF